MVYKCHLLGISSSRAKDVNGSSELDQQKTGLSSICAKVLQPRLELFVTVVRLFLVVITLQVPNRLKCSCHLSVAVPKVHIFSPFTSKGKAHDASGYRL